MSELSSAILDEIKKRGIFSEYLYCIIPSVRRGE